MKTTRLILLTILMTTILAGSFAQIPYSKGRIAMSSDGNFADEDDWAATPVALMMLAKAGLQDQFVLYTYADHVWGTLKNDGISMLPEIKKSVEGARDRWNFNKTKFVEAVTTPELAYNSMRDEINKSSADDPLIIICAGPMQVVGEGLYRANADKLQYVTLVSHSTWNDNHAVEPFSWESHASTERLWSWDKMKTDFLAANFVHINDQNEAGDATKGFNTNWVGGVKGGTQAWSYWNWLRDSSDESMNWVYQRLQKVGRADASDAGMTWYVIHGSEGNPIKLKDYIGSCVNCDGSQSFEGIQYGTDYVVFESETATLPAGWALRKKGDAGYQQFVRFPNEIEPINDTYIENVSNNNNSTIRYTFTAPKTGTYQLAMRMHSMIREIEPSSHSKEIIVNGETLTVEKDDKRNDVFIRIEGNFESATYNYTTEDLKTNEKFYGRGPSKWGNCYKLEHNGHRPPKYNFTAGEEYTLVITGRSPGTCIDYIVLFDVAGAGNITLNDQDLAKQLPERYRPGAAGTTPPQPQTCTEILAHDFTTLQVSGYDVATKGWIPQVPEDGVNHGAEVMVCKGEAGLTTPVAAEYTYTGSAMDAIFSVKAVTEPDGECTYEVFVNGTKVGDKAYARTHGTSTPAYTYEDLVMNTTPVSIESGDVIRVTSNQVSNNLVAEGDGFATARGRWRSLNICSEGASEEPQVAASFTIDNKSSYTEDDFTIGGTMDITLRYHAGTGNTVTNGKGGVRIFLRVIDLNNGWAPVGTGIKLEDASAIGKTSGITNFSIPLDGLTPSTDLPDGHVYQLFPLFDNSAGGIFNIGGMTKLKIVATSTFATSATTDSNIQIFPNPTSGILNIKNAEGMASIIDISGAVLKSKNVSNKDMIDISMLKDGIYFISFKQKNESSKVIKVIKK